MYSAHFSLARYPLLFIPVFTLPGSIEITDVPYFFFKSIDKFFEIELRADLLVL